MNNYLIFRVAAGMLINEQHKRKDLTLFHVLA